jgi:hypothetical protein
MAIDTIEKRASISGIPFGIPGVVPDATASAIWRLAVAWLYGFVLNLARARAPLEARPDSGLNTKLDEGDYVYSRRTIKQPLRPIDVLSQADRPLDLTTRKP